MSLKLKLFLFAILLQLTSLAQQKLNLDEMFQTSLDKFEAKQYKQANTILDFILESDSSYFKAHIVKIDVLVAERKYKSALLYANKALALKTNNTDIICKRALVLFKLRQYKEAKDAYGKILDKDPKSVKALYGWAHIENRMKNHEHAIQILNKAKKIESKNLNVLYELGYAYFNTNEDLKAIKQFDKILKMNPKYQAESIYTMRGACKNAMENPIGAILDYREALKLNPTNASLYNNIAMIYAYQGKDEKALKYLNASIKLNNKQGLVFYNRGLSHYQLKHYELAYHDFEKACQLGCKKREEALGYYNSLKKRLKK